MMNNRHVFNRKNQRNAIRYLKKWDYLTRVDFYSEWGRCNAEWLLQTGFISIDKGVNSRLIITYTEQGLKEYGLV